MPSERSSDGTVLRIDLPSTSQLDPTSGGLVKVSDGRYYAVTLQPSVVAWSGSETAITSTSIPLGDCGPVAHPSGVKDSPEDVCQHRQAGLAADAASAVWIVTQGSTGHGISINAVTNG